MQDITEIHENIVSQNLEPYRTCLIVGYLPQWMSQNVDTLDVYFMDEQTTSKTLDISLHTGTSPACVAQHRQWVQHISHNM